MPDLSVWLETLHCLQPGHIAIMVHCSLVWRQIQSFQIARLMLNLVKWAYCHPGSVCEKWNTNKAVYDLERLFLRMANNAKPYSIVGKVYSKQEPYFANSLEIVYSKQCPLTRIVFEYSCAIRLSMIA